MSLPDCNRVSDEAFSKSNREGYIFQKEQWFIEIRNAFSDFYLTIEDMIAEGDKVVTRWTFRGANTGDRVVPMPLPATGKQVSVSGITISHLAGNQVVEDWHQADNLGFMQQLGVIPAQGQAS